MDIATNKGNGQVHASESNGLAVTNGHLANRAINARTDLSPSAKSVLLAIADKAGHGKSTCTASLDTLAEMTGKGRRWLRRLVNRLARNDWITVEKRRCPRRGYLPHEMRIGPRFIQAAEEQVQREREEREKKRSHCLSFGQTSDKLSDPGGQSTPSQGVNRPLPRGSIDPPNDSVLTAPSNGKTTTTLSGRASRVPKESSSSFAALPNESGGTEGASSEVLDPKRLETAVKKLVSLKLKLDTEFPAPMDRETAERVIREAVGESMAVLRRLAWAITDPPLAHYSASAQIFPDGHGACRFVWIANLLPDSMADAVAGKSTEETA